MVVTDTLLRPGTDSTQPEDSDQLSTSDDRWRRIRRRAGIGYVVILAVFVIVVGIPTDREGLLLWILGAFGIRCLGKGWRSFGRVLLDWLPFTLVLELYDVSRGFADGLGMTIHILEPAHADLWMFSGTLPTQWMQQHLYVPGDPRWYDAIATMVYTSHFLATPLLAALLWVRNRQVWAAFIRRVIALSMAGLVTYVLYPAAPPWYAAKEGLIDPVARLTSRGWYELGLNHAGRVLAKGQADVNLVAAMPSLHTAFSTLIAMFFFRRVPVWARPLLVLYPLAMGVTLVYTGEHYVVDLLFGYVFAVVIMVGMWFGERWWAARRLRRTQNDTPLNRPVAA